MKRWRHIGLKYLCDDSRHLICVPYSVEGLHKMAKDLDIKRCWFHKDHYDIPKRRIKEIQDKCMVCPSKSIVRIIKDPERLTDTEMDLWYDLIDDHLTNGRFEKVEEILEEFKECDDVEFVLTLLATTLPAKNRLKHRPEMVKIAIDKWEENRPPYIFDGLK